MEARIPTEDWRPRPFSQDIDGFIIDTVECVGFSTGVTITDKVDRIPPQ